jgi:hypothetical protein
MLSIIVSSVIILSMLVLNIIMFRIIILNDIMQSVVMPSVVNLIVAAPFCQGIIGLSTICSPGIHFIPCLHKPGNTKGYHCTIDLLFDWFGISCMTTDNFVLFASPGKLT